MKNKHFGLAAITVVGGIVATMGGGCSGGLLSVSDDAGTGGSSGSSSGTSGSSSGTSGGSSSSSSGSVDSGDGAASDASTAGDTGAVVECTGATPINATLLPWKPPFVSVGSCTKAELDALVTYIDVNDAAKYADWKTSVGNATCRSCIFGKESDSTWKPLLENALGEMVGLNVGGCIAIASGSEACGKSYQNWFDCRFEACADCPSGDTAALQKCLSAASKSGCKTAFDSVGPTCGDQVLSDAENACDGDKFVFEGPIRAQCVGPAGDF